MKPSYDELFRQFNAASITIENLEAQVKQLAAESALQKIAIEQTIGWQESVDPSNAESVRLLVGLGTPGTEAFLSRLRAEGVQMFARSLRGEAEITKACTFKSVQQFEDFATRADEFVQLLREGKAGEVQL